MLHFSITLDFNVYCSWNTTLVFLPFLLSFCIFSSESIFKQYRYKNNFNTLDGYIFRGKLTFTDRFMNWLFEILNSLTFGNLLDGTMQYIQNLVSRSENFESNIFSNSQFFCFCFIFDKCESRSYSASIIVNIYI